MGHIEKKHISQASTIHNFKYCQQKDFDNQRDKMRYVEV